MKFIFKLIILKLLFLYSFGLINFSQADNHNIYETLENIQNDLKTLERAVYYFDLPACQAILLSSTILNIFPFLSMK